MMINNMKAYELNEQELNQVAGGGIIQDVKDLLEIGCVCSYTDSCQLIGQGYTTR